MAVSSKNNHALTRDVSRVCGGEWCGHVIVGRLADEGCSEVPARRPGLQSVHRDPPLGVDVVVSVNHLPILQPHHPRRRPPYTAGKIKRRQLLLHLVPDIIFNNYVSLWKIQEKIH